MKFTFAFALDVGATLRGRFRLEEKLKDGLGISTCSGWDLTSRRSAVVKAAPLSEISAPELLEHEAQVLSKLGCPNLGTLLSAGRQDRYFYLAYRYVEGESLEQ